MCPIKIHCGMKTHKKTGNYWIFFGAKDHFGPRETMEKNNVFTHTHRETLKATCINIVVPECKSALVQSEGHSVLSLNIMPLR